jgi:hypothetical protein
MDPVTGVSLYPWDVSNDPSAKQGFAKKQHDGAKDDLLMWQGMVNIYKKRVALSEGKGDNSDARISTETMINNLQTIKASMDDHLKYTEIRVLRGTRCLRKKTLNDNRPHYPFPFPNHHYFLCIQPPFNILSFSL